jgi:hypothetical protein
MTRDYTGPDPTQHPSKLPPLDVQAFVRGDDLQGRHQNVSDQDRLAAREYVREWRVPERDYYRSRGALNAKKYGYWGSCPMCRAEGSVYYPPFEDHWIVCSAGCKVRWFAGTGLFVPHLAGKLPEEEVREIVEKLFREYAEVKGLLGWRAEALPMDPREADLAIRMIGLGSVGECTICGVDAVPEDLRLLARFHLLGGYIGHRVPVVSFSRWAPLCMTCGEEASCDLQQVVNGMWGIGPSPDGPAPRRSEDVTGTRGD